MIVVHHLNNSRSQRILWLLEELGLEYRIERYQRNAKTMLAPPELKAVHPLGKSPVLTDGEGDAKRTLAESGAIVEYLIHTYGEGRFMPAPDTNAYWECRRWTHYAEGSAMPPLLLKLVFDTIKTAPMPFFIRPVAKGIADKAMSGFVQPQLDLHIAHWEQSLEATGWLAGDDLTVADIMMSFPVEAARSRAGVDARHPNLLDWLKRLHARPAYQLALEKGGPYDYA